MPSETTPNGSSAAASDDNASRLPVALFMPNLLGYARILLAGVGLMLSFSRPTAAVVVWYISASLDLFDGILARKFDQCSSFGVLVDVAADNVLRTCMWMAVACQSKDSPTTALASAGIVVVEWTTMLCTQLHASAAGRTHWKHQRENDPAIVRMVFANNFRGPMGILSIYGLFAANGFAYGSHHAELAEKIPLFALWKWIAYAGRVLSLVVELWLCKGYLSYVIEKDMADRKAEAKAKPS